MVQCLINCYYVTEWTNKQATKGVIKGGWTKDGNLYEVETGRRDGRVSHATEAVKHLPDSFDGIRKLTKRFASKGLDLKDLVVLSGIYYLYKSPFIFVVTVFEVKNV